MAMLSGPDIERAAAQLASYRAADSLPDILDAYSNLIDRYRRLKSDYEEERDAREKYKQLARGQDRNPFVLVLVDGDGYLFNEALLTKGADGGSQAAQLLNEAVKADLAVKGLEQCQVMIHVYANVAGLSKALSKAGLAGAEKRSLGSFIASFNRSHGLAAFVDAGELKENADFKLRAMMSLYADIAQCKHIYFAACHDVGYISELMPYQGNRARFTLVDAPGVRFHDEFHKLDLAVDEFRGVFMSTSLDDLQLQRSAAGLFSSAKAALVGGTAPQVEQAPCRADGPKTVCKFYPTGRCKYGKTCKNLHVQDSKPTARSADNGLQMVTEGSVSEPRRKSSPLSGSRSDVAPDFIFGQGKRASSPETGYGFLELPRKDDVPEGQVAVNKNGFRLDPRVPPPDCEVQKRLWAHVSRQRVCNSFHLNGFCDAGSSCPYDHSPLDEALKPALELMARSMPCSRRGACRNATCTSGHVCQIASCAHRGGKTYCRLPNLCHGEDLCVARFVPAADDRHSHQALSARGGASTKTSEENEKNWGGGQYKDPWAI